MTLRRFPRTRPGYEQRRGVPSPDNSGRFVPAKTPKTEQVETDFDRVNRIVLETQKKVDAITAKRSARLLR